MKLYLTSNGFEDSAVADYFKNLVLPRQIADLSFLVISVQDSDSDAVYLQKTINELKGIGVINIEVFKLREDKFVSSKEYDVIFVCGGNTFVYLDRIRKTGLDKFIIDAVKGNRSIYVGVSAGSIVAGPDIAIAGDEDSNDIRLTDLTGLELTDRVIYPHYTEGSREYLDSFQKTSKFPVIKISDTQAVYLDYSDEGALKSVKVIEQGYV